MKKSGNILLYSVVGALIAYFIIQKMKANTPALPAPDSAAAVAAADAVILAKNS